MGSAQERGRGAEPFGIGQRAGFQGCLPSGEVYRGQAQLSARSPCDRLEGRGCGHHRMQCQEGSGSRGGAGPRSAAAPGLPTASGSRAQELTKSRSSSVRAPAHPSPGSTLGESQRWLGPLCLGKCPACRLPSPPLTRSENPLNRGRNPDALVVPRLLPSPRPRPPPGQLPPLPPPRGGPSLA